MYIVFCERNAFFNIPLLDIEIVERLSVDGGISVVCTIDGLTACRYFWRNESDIFLLVQNSLVVCNLQGLHR